MLLMVEHGKMQINNSILLFKESYYLGITQRNMKFKTLRLVKPQGFFIE